MTRYRYRAHNAAGHHVDDETEASSPFELIESLQAEGFTVTAVEPVGRNRLHLPGFQALRWEELRLFSEQLEAIFRSGYPLVPALAALAADIHHPALRQATEQLQSDLKSGRSLDEAFRMQEHRFPPIFGALMRAGEATGNLAGVLEMMTQHATRMAAMKHRIKSTLAYPLVLLVSAASVVLYQLLYVVPVFAEIFSEVGGVLPAPTRFLLYVSKVLVNYWPILTIAAPVLALGAVVLYLALRRTREWRHMFDTCLLYIPGAGMAYQNLVQARFCRTLALLLSARIPMIDALTLAGAASGSAVLERGIERAASAISEGGRLVDALRQTAFFSPSFYWLLGTAEERDQVEDALGNLAENAERSLRAREDMLGSLVTPAITVLAGAAVGFIVLAMYLPIFDLGDQIGGN
ncbi:MAG: type II secretion system F family protein [Candidatus Hydrogenedentes bacterium]|nr:type II secretion system F family protein [Candidatus Hydrogenedentota bacterium]